MRVALTGVATAPAARRLALAALVVLPLAAGCGASSGSGSARSGASTTVRTTTRTVTVTTPSSPAATGAETVRTPSDATRRRLSCDRPCDDFQTPSTNIKCTALGGKGGEVECDIGSGLDPKPSGNPCSFGDLVGLRVSPTGSARFACRSDVPLAGIDRKIPTLPYAAVWHGFDVFCVSQASGLSCLNADGHGFFLSRGRWTTF